MVVVPDIWNSFSWCKCKVEKRACQVLYYRLLLIWEWNIVFERNAVETNNIITSRKISENYNIVSNLKTNEINNIVSSFQNTETQRTSEVTDVYLGQLPVQGSFDFGLPAVLFEYSVDYGSCVLDVNLHVLGEYIQAGATTSGTEDKMKYFRFLRILKRCLNGVKIPPVFGPLAVYRDTPVQTESCVYHQLTFKRLNIIVILYFGG